MAGKIDKTMKKYISMFAMAQMIIWSCAKPEIDTPASVTPDTDGVVFTALADAAMTKANPAAGGVVSWTENDEIGVYDGTDYVKAEIISVEGNKVTFSANVNKEADKYIAVSPYEFALTGEGEFTMDGDNVRLNTASTSQTAGKQVISIAAISAPTEPFAFKNVCNLLRFKVEKATVKQAKITGAAGTEKIAGVLSVNPSTGEATGTLTETSIVAPVTPGVDNFIALAPGTNLPDGFTITLYGNEISDAGYEGEVASAGAVNFTGENARNKMLYLGTIDGWIDNWALWQKGKPITIAGVEYTKASTGFNGTLLTAKTGDYDTFAGGAENNNVKLYGNKGVFFLDTANGYKFISSTFINVGTATSNSSMFLISRYDNAPVPFEPGKHFTLMSGNLYCKGINFDHKNSASTYMFGSNNPTFGTFVLDKCKVVLHQGDCLIYYNGTGQFGIQHVKVVNSKIQSTWTDRVIIINTSSTFKQWNYMETVTFDNNVFYNENVDGRVTIMGDNAPAPSTGTQHVAVSITNNTFYNMSIRGGVSVRNYSLGSLVVTGNLFSSPAATLSGYSHIAQSDNVSSTYTYSFENNVSDYPRIYLFNPNQPGYNQNLKLSLGQTTDLAFKKVDLVNGVFIPIDKYASYGAKQ